MALLTHMNLRMFFLQHQKGTLICSKLHGYSSILVVVVVVVVIVAVAIAIALALFFSGEGKETMNNCLHKLYR